MIEFVTLICRRLVASNLPHLDRVLTEHNIELSLITVNWLLRLGVPHTIGS